MKKIFLLIVFGFIVACSNFNNRSPSNTGDELKNKPRHLIITVHGLSGDEKTWGYFGDDNYTKKYLEQLNSKYNVEVTNFVYPTGKDEKNGAFEFANYLDFFIKEKFKNNHLQPSDKISFVCHSQGGLITFIWFFKNILSYTRNEPNSYVEHVDSIITLGTPFWGSKIATILTGKDSFDIFPFLGLTGMRATRHEVADMAFGSDTIDLFRKMAIQLDNNPDFYEKIKNLPFRVINISGVLPKNKKDLTITSNTGAATVDLPNITKKLIDVVYKVFKTFGFGRKDQAETDLAVIVPNSRWNFIYANSQKIAPLNENNATQKISTREFKSFQNFSDRSKVLFVESVHLPLDSANTYSMANINKDCSEVSTCEHPTYRYIIEHLANCKKDGETSSIFYTNDCNRSAYSNIIEKMKVVNLVEHKKYKNMSSTLEAFTIQINIKLDPGSLDKFKLKYLTQVDGYSLTGEKIYNPNWNINGKELVSDILDLNTDSKDKSIISNQDLQVVLGDKTESTSISIVAKNMTPVDGYEYLRVFITGYAQKKEAVKNKIALTSGERPVENISLQVPLDLKIPGQRPVHLDLVVQPTYSTYIDLDYSTQ